MAGEMDVWDRRSFKKVITMQASNPSSCDWSPDGRHFMTSTLYKRLKVDNGVKIYHYSGVLVHEVNVKELHQAQWVPQPATLWPERLAYSPPPTGLRAAVPAVKSGKYVPPGARNGTTPSRNIFVNIALV
jgi:translation initiation factor 2A